MRLACSIAALPLVVCLRKGRHIKDSVTEVVPERIHPCVVWVVRRVQVQKRRRRQATSVEGQLAAAMYVPPAALPGLVPIAGYAKRTRSNLWMRHMNMPPTPYLSPDFVAHCSLLRVRMTICSRGHVLMHSEGCRMTYLWDRL